MFKPRTPSKSESSWTEEEEIWLGNDDASLRIGIAQIARQKQLIYRIRSQENGELDVMFLKFG